MRQIFNILGIILLLIFASDTITPTNASSMSLHGDEYFTALREQQFAESYIKVADDASRVYFYIDKYCDKYGVPKRIAYSVAKLETNYKGPNDKKYNPYQVSPTYAYGVMQVVYSTAIHVWNDDATIRANISREKLLYDIDFNVHTGVKYLSILYNEYGSWPVTLGFYNTGYAKINEYAIQGTR